MTQNLNKIVNSLKNEADKLQADIKKWSHSVKPQATAKIKAVEGKYRNVVKQLQIAQKDLNKELHRTILIVRKHQSKLAKTLTATKKTTRRRTTKKAATLKA